MKLYHDDKTKRKKAQETLVYLVNCIRYLRSEGFERANESFQVNITSKDCFDRAQQISFSHDTRPEVNLERMICDGFSVNYDYDAITWYSSDFVKDDLKIGVAFNYTGKNEDFSCGRECPKTKQFLINYSFTLEKEQISLSDLREFQKCKETFLKLQTCKKLVKGGNIKLNKEKHNEEQDEEQKSNKNPCEYHIPRVSSGVLK
jgi:hypothetical protein